MSADLTTALQRSFQNICTVSLANKTSWYIITSLVAVIAFKSLKVKSTSKPTGLSLQKNYWEVVGRDSNVVISICFMEKGWEVYKKHHGMGTITAKKQCNYFFFLLPLLQKMPYTISLCNTCKILQYIFFLDFRIKYLLDQALCKPSPNRAVLDPEAQ